MNRSERMYREMVAIEAARMRRVRARRVEVALWVVGCALLGCALATLVAWRVRDPGWRASAARQVGLALAWGED